MADAKRIYQALEYLVGMSHALLEANNEEIECRNDEDCDHCCFMASLDQAERVLKEETTQARKECEDCEDGVPTFTDPLMGLKCHESTDSHIGPTVCQAPKAAQQEREGCYCRAAGNMGSPKPPKHEPHCPMSQAHEATRMHDVKIGTKVCRRCGEEMPVDHEGSVYTSGTCSAREDK